MALDPEQIEKLLSLVSTTEDDQLDCDGCMDHIAEFADAQLLGRPLNEALQIVEIHLKSCLCCADEYQALSDALKAIDSDK